MPRIGRFVVTDTSGPFPRAGSSWRAGKGTARTLRTTQWTRASFEPILRDGFILMILKIISQFRVGSFGVRSDSLMKTHVISSL